MEISQQQKEIFLKDGVLVVDNVIPMDVIEKAKASLAMELADYGVVRSIPLYCQLYDNYRILKIWSIRANI